jgi:hypothetical protein
VALIAMVTFAAAFTIVVPFIFTVFIHVLISLIKGLEMNKNKDISEDTIEISFEFATLFTMIGMETMIITINICLFGLSFFFLVYLMFKDHLQGFMRLDLLVKQSILNFLSNKTPMYFFKKFLLFLKNNRDVICSEIMFLFPNQLSIFYILFYN